MTSRWYLQHVQLSAMEEQVPNDEIWFDIVRSINNVNGLDEQYGKYAWLQDFRSVNVELQPHEARRTLSGLIRQFKQDPSHVIEVLQQFARDVWVQGVAYWVSKPGLSVEHEDKEAYAECWAYVHHGLEKLMPKGCADQYSLEPRNRRWPVREPLQHGFHPTRVPSSIEDNPATINVISRFQEEFEMKNEHRPFRKLAR